MNDATEAENTYVWQGERYTPFLRALRTGGYREETQVRTSGDFLVSGDTITVYPVNARRCYRLHFLSEKLEKVETSEPGEVLAWEKAAHFPAAVANTVTTEHGKVWPEQYIVHPSHGIGIFEYLETRYDEREQTDRLYVNLRYAENDRLLFPAERQHELMPYLGSKHPRLTRLYSKVWQHTKERIARDLIAIARGLLKLYAARQVSQRETVPVNREWEAVIAASAGFTLTADQEKAWREIRSDLSQRQEPMDRLVCGDVGFGKTELALRAAAQVVAAGKQVAILAPTTVLAEQHFTVVRERFANLPVQVGEVSRLNAQQTVQTLVGLQDGTVDLVVGTHRLLGKDVQFRSLGLLIVDEEQKFGVAHKERLKRLRPHLDVLSLSATPIPRTLYLALSGLRGLSILSQAPAGRQPIRTTVAPYDPARLTQALTAEFARGGSVYLVHNRVRTMERVFDHLSELLGGEGFRLARFRPGEAFPEGDDVVTAAIAHGQMDEALLAETMSAFLSGRIQLLLASTIVENGLDSPHANTLVVLHSERFGLADLYQLRGRVGRRETQAYAYFFTGGVETVAYQGALAESDQAALPVNAQARLAVLGETEELGSGWTVAVRDLEIRGGGNILGHEQHGNLEAIGLLLYAQLLQEEIGRQAKKLGIDLFQKSTSAE